MQLESHYFKFVLPNEFIFTLAPRDIIAINYTEFISSRFVIADLKLPSHAHIDPPSSGAIATFTKSKFAVILKFLARTRVLRPSDQIQSCVAGCLQICPLQFIYPHYKFLFDGNHKLPSYIGAYE